MIRNNIVKLNNPMFAIGSIVRTTHVYDFKFGTPTIIGIVMNIDYLKDNQIYHIEEIDRKRIHQIESGWLEYYE